MISKILKHVAWKKMLAGVLCSVPALSKNTTRRFDFHHALLIIVTFAATACAAPAQAAIPCADLVNLKIATSDIGLRSGGVTISSAAMATVPADPATPDVKRDYCKVLGALDTWVNTGKAPDQLLQVTQEKQMPFKVTASRPMCRYPLTPRHDGHGDPNQASSFACANQ